MKHNLTIAIATSGEFEAAIRELAEEGTISIIKEQENEWEDIWLVQCSKLPPYKLAHEIFKRAFLADNPIHEEWEEGKLLETHIITEEDCDINECGAVYSDEFCCEVVIEEDENEMECWRNEGYEFDIMLRCGMD